MYSDLKNFPKIIENDPYKKYLITKRKVDQNNYLSQIMATSEDPSSIFANINDSKEATIKINCNPLTKTCETSEITRRKFLRGRMYAILFKMKTKLNRMYITNIKGKMQVENNKYICIKVTLNIIIFTTSLIIFMIGCSEYIF